MKLPKIKPAELPAKGAVWADDRLAAASPTRRLMNKVFPDHWSFMIGEIALYSFIILLLTGTFLTLFFDPSMKEVHYDGSYAPLRGLPMSQAYATSLDISFDVRGGLIMRQIHHWSALLFMAAMMVHMFRVFFTGAFRRPRELNWIIGITLIVLGILEGFAGYSLPDDALSGTGLRIMSAIVLSIPVVGTWVSFAVFGGEFPGEVIIPRLYIAHVLIVPGILLGLIAAHMGLLVKQKHTQFPGPLATEKNVVGHRMFPGFAAKGGGFFMIVFGVVALLAGWFQINPIWIFGPYRAEVVSAGSQPDFYVGWLDGSTRLWPAWETRLGRLHAAGGVLAHGGAAGHHVHARGALPVPGGQVQQGQGSPQPAAAAAGRTDPYLARRDGHRVLHGALDLRRQRHHRREVRHQPQRDDLDRPDRIAGPSRRWRSGRRTGSASVCSSTTARCWPTAWRPASSSGCRPARSSRYTSRSRRLTSTVTWRWSTPAPRYRRR